MMPLLKWLTDNWVKLALTIATLLYLPFAYSLIRDSGACTPSAAMDSPLWDFYYRYLACRKANEIGDTFAGFFAPLAFIWLAGAVYIQSQELAAQRKELDETQGLMERQLEVAQQQVEETKASTALFRKQTEILEKEQTQRDEKQADEEFDQRLENLKIVLVQLGGVSLSVWGYLVPESKTDPTDEIVLNQANGEDFELLPDISSRTPSGDIPHVLHLLARNINRVFLSRYAHHTKFEITHWNHEKLMKLRDLLRKVSNDSRGLSAKYHLKLDGLGIQNLALRIDELKSVVIYNAGIFKSDHPSDYLLE